MHVQAETIPGHVLFKRVETQEMHDAGKFYRHFCGGVKVGKKLYLTAAHCTRVILPEQGQLEIGKKFKLGSSENADDEVLITVKSFNFPSNTVTVAKMITCAYDSCSYPKNVDWQDLALVESEEENNLPIAQVSSSSPTINLKDDLIVSGSQLILGILFYPEASSAHVLNVLEMSATGQLFGGSSTMNHGDSGSPVWREANGVLEIVGIISAKRNSSEFVFTIVNSGMLSLGKFK